MSWLFPAEPLARLARLRAALYLFVVADVFLVTPWVAAHGHVSGVFYRPVLIPRLLGLPTPTPALVRGTQVVLVVAALVAAAGRLPRVAGWVVAAAYAEWMFVAMSYGKVDHDHFAILAAVCVLPTVGRAGWSDPDRSDAAGFALRVCQLSVVATYLLAAWAKFRFGGWGWANGETFYWAMTRRGTGLGRALLEAPWLLHAAQWAVLVAELVAPLLLVLRGRGRYALLLFFVGFHVASYATLRIHFLPHVVCLLAFAPLERLRVRVPARAPAPALPAESPA